MRHAFVTLLRRCSIIVGLIAAAALPPSPAAAGQAIYRWRDGNGQLHFSNDPDHVPTGADQVAAAEPASARSSSSRLSGVARSALGAEVAPPRGRPVTGGCGPADPSQLIGAITSRLASRPSVSGSDSELTLFVSGVPVWYDSSAVVQTLPGGTADDRAAEADGAAIAYPASGGCPLTPPLERYGTTAPSRETVTPSSAICSDFHRASAEIFAALSRNQAVADTFEMAAARYEALSNGEAGGVNLPPWLVQAQAAQTAELAAETEDFVDELAVAQEEIDDAAHARGCW